MGNNIYWADEGISAIRLAKISNTTLIKTIVHDNVSNLKALAIDHKHRYITYKTE